MTRTSTTRRCVSTAWRAQRDLLILNPGYPDPAGGVAATVLAAVACRRIRTCRCRTCTRCRLASSDRLSQTLNLQASFMSHARPQPAAFAQRERAGRVRRASRADDRHGDADRIDRPFVDRSVEREPPLPGACRGARSSTSATRCPASGVTRDNPLSLPANSLNPDAEWGPSSQDIRHRLNAIAQRRPAVWHPRQHRRNRAVGRAVHDHHRPRRQPRRRQQRSAGRCRAQHRAWRAALGHERPLLARLRLRRIGREPSSRSRRRWRCRRRPGARRRAASRAAAREARVPAAGRSCRRTRRAGRHGTSGSRWSSTCRRSTC